MRPKNSRRSRKKSTLRTVLLVLIAVLFGVFLFSGWRLYSTLREYKIAEAQYNGVSGLFTQRRDDPGSNSQTSLADPRAGEETSPIQVNFVDLKKTGPEVIGWIWQENTVINYPVVQAEDNDYYLHRFIDGSYSAGGSIFTDCKNTPDFSDHNTIVYGHHMNDGSMFASLRNYRYQSYYDEHPTLYLNTPGGNFRIEVFAGYVCDADSDTYTFVFGSGEEFAAWAEKMRSQSDFHSDVPIGMNDKVVTLSTCSYEYWDARYVVQGKLVPIN